MTETEILKEFEEYCKALPIIYSVENRGNYLKLNTEILFKKAESYLSLYLVVEDDGVCLSDSNSVCDFCDAYYDTSDEFIEKCAKQVDLDFENFRLTKYVTLSSIETEINKFEKLKNLVELV